MGQPITSRQAAELLGVSPGRVRQLVRDGKLEASRFGNALLLDSQRVQEFAHLRLPSPHRPLGPSAAWDLIGSHQLDWLIADDLRDLTRRRLRQRAHFQQGFAHRSVLPKLESSDVLVWSGLRAAEEHGVPVDSRNQPLVGYIKAADLDGLPPVTWRSTNSSESWNIQIGVIAEDVPWPYDNQARFVDPITCWIDLEDHQERAARLALEQLPTILRESGWHAK